MGGVASSLGLGMAFSIGKGAICAPYSIPLGYLNYNNYITIDACYESVSASKKVQEHTNGVKSSGVNRMVGLKKPGFSSTNRMKVVNSNVVEILNENITMKSQNQEIIQDVNNNFGLARIGAKLDNENNIVPNEKGPWSDYDIQQMNEMKWNHNGYVMQAYNCEAEVDQTATLEIIGNQSINEEVIEEISNEVTGGLEAELLDSAPAYADPRTLQIQMDTLSEVKNLIKVNITNKINQFIEQNSSIGQKIIYEDNYGVCDPVKYDERGTYVGTTIRQSAKITSLASNIINSSVDVVIDNTTTVNSKNSAKITKILEYRIIVFSFLWNILYIYMLYVLIMYIINKAL